MKKVGIIISSIAGLLVVGGIAFCIIKKPFNSATQIEQMIEDEYQETEASGDVSENETQEATETSSEQAERQNQDADHTEQGHNDNTNDSKPNTETTESKPSTEQQHTHTWVTETRYKTVHHDAKSHTVHHDAQTHVVHHDAVTHQETQTTYTTEYEAIHHDGDYWCNTCGAHFSSTAEANAHCDSDINCYMNGYSGNGGWDETVEVQVPHTETVTIVDQPAWDETVVDKAAWDETVVDHEAYDEQVPYTVTVCSECGKEK